MCDCFPSTLCSATHQYWVFADLLIRRLVGNFCCFILPFSCFSTFSTRKRKSDWNFPVIVLVYLKRMQRTKSRSDTSHMKHRMSLRVQIITQFTCLPPVVKTRNLESISNPIQRFMITMFSSQKHVSKSVECCLYIHKWKLKCLNLSVQ